MQNVKITVFGIRITWMLKKRINDIQKLKKISVEKDESKYDLAAIKMGAPQRSLHIYCRVCHKSTKWPADENNCPPLS